MASALRVLLIDEPETDSDLLLAELRRGGYELSWRRVDSAAALEDALTHEWDVALCNWNARGLPAREALSIVRARGAELAVIAVSDGPGSDASVEAIRSGADDFVAGRSSTALLPAAERAMHEAEIRRARRRAAEVLREGGERFAQAFEHAPIGMAIVGIDGVLLHANPALCQMLGYSRAEMSGVPVWRVTHPEDMPATVEQLQRLVEGDTDAWHLEKRFFHRDGRVIWARSTTWLVRGPDGSARYVVSHVQDITEQRRLEEQTRHQQDELAHALRLATMGEMVAQIAHEINQPLGSIANFANAMTRRLDDVEMMRAAATRIAAEALRASDVIRRVRAFLHRGESKRECCEASEVIRDAVRLMEPEMREHRVALSLDLTAERTLIEVDRVQIVQVVLNLLRNSVEAIAAANDDRRELEVHTAPTANGAVLVSIRDSGIGLPGPDVAEIFEAFFTTKKRGLGLGLSISRSIIDAHRGHLWAQANRDGGATVAFSLPIRRD